MQTVVVKLDTQTSNALDELCSKVHQIGGTSVIFGPEQKGLLQNRRNKGLRKITQSDLVRCAIIKLNESV